MADPAKPYIEAVRRLTRRPLTVLELRDRLERSGHPPVEVEAALERLLADGSLDDLALSSHYMAARMERLGHGPNRLVRELVRRGVNPPVAREALDTGLEQGDLDPERVLEREVRRRISGESVTPREFRRVYNAMLRAGFEPLSIRRTLDRYRRDPGSDESEFPQE